MELKTVLQILNVIFLGLFGAASGRMINEWRSSREERHKAELASLASEAKASEAINERLRATDQHEIEKREIQIAKLTGDNERLTQARSERMELLEEQIRVLRSQAPAGVAADIDGLMKVHERQLLIRQKAVEECEAARAEELSKYQATLESREQTIEQLKTNDEIPKRSTGPDIWLQSILLDSQRKTLEREQEALSPPAQQSQLVAQLRGSKYFGDSPLGQLVDLALARVGLFIGKQVMRHEAAIYGLTMIGDPVIPKLEKLLSAQRKVVSNRARITLLRMNSDKANEALKRHGRLTASEKFQGSKSE